MVVMVVVLKVDGEWREGGSYLVTGCLVFVVCCDLFLPAME